MLCLATLVIAYGISINLVEVSWKSQLKLQYPNSNDYNTFIGYFSTITGAVTILMMLFIGGNVIRKKRLGLCRSDYTGCAAHHRYGFLCLRSV